VTTARKARRSPVKRGRKRPKTEYVDEEYKRFVWTLPCRAALALGHARECEGRIEAAHVGRRGLHQLAHPRTLIPLCSWHHRYDAHDHATRNGKPGFIASMSKDDRRDWYDAQIAEVNDLFEASRGRL